MNEHKRIEQFNRDIDDLINNRQLSSPLTTENEPLLALAQTLVQTDLSNDSQQLNAIRQNILNLATGLESTSKTLTNTQSQKVRNSTYEHKMIRAFALSFTLLIVMTFVVIAIPPLRALAQDILRQIGVITVTDAPTYYDVWSTRPTLNPASTPILDVTPQVYDTQHLSVQQANNLTGFNMLISSYIPAGYRLYSHDVWQKNGLNSIRTSYNNLETDDSIIISQTIYDLNNPNQSREFPLGDAPLTDVTVHGFKGVWAQQVSTWPPGTGINMLFWQEGDFAFMMQSAKLPMDEMLKIANSLSSS